MSYKNLNFWWVEYSSAEVTLKVLEHYSAYLNFKYLPNYNKLVRNCLDQNTPNHFHASKYEIKSSNNFLKKITRKKPYIFHKIIVLLHLKIMWKNIYL